VTPPSPPLLPAARLLFCFSLAMDPLSELQDDLTLDDTSQALNQLKLASIDEKNWPSDEMPDFPKSGGQHNVSGSCDTTEGRSLPAGRDSRG
jgi:hypothetical protein